MYANRTACRIALFSVCLVVFGASMPSVAKPQKKNSNAQLTAMQKKIEGLEAQLLKHNEQIVALTAFAQRPVEVKAPADVRARLDNEQLAALMALAQRPVELKARLEPTETSFTQSAEQAAPLASAGIALTAAVIALGAYLLNKRSTSNTHMHGVFRDYLKMRFDYHQKILEKSEPQQKVLTEAPLNNAGETLPQQLGGIELYALEEIFVWSNTWTAKLRSRISPHQRDILKAWENTIKSHIRLYPEDVKGNVVQFRECYGITFLMFVASVLRSPEVTEVVEEQLAAYQAGRERPAGTALSCCPRGTVTGSPVPSG
jgi:hypothetical protein